MLALFTDGACSGNPGPGGWACVLAGPEGRVRELAGREDRTTNNRMELTAAIEGLRACRGLPGTLLVHTDSTYVIGGITEWIAGWKRRGWRTAEGQPVKNEDLWRTLDALAVERGRGGLEWRWVRGHSGHDANERCDELAVSYSRGAPLPLWAGPIAQYPHGSLLPSDETAVPPQRGSRDPRAPAAGPAVYLSYVDGRLERHGAWRDCESRVKGRRGARFKKVTSAAEEQAVLKAWGLAR